MSRRCGGVQRRELRGALAGELLALAAGVAWASEQSGGQGDLIPRLLSIAVEGLATGGRSTG